MRGMMMDVPLLTTSIMRHAAEYHGDTEIVSRLPDGSIHRTDYARTWRRCGRLARALVALGLSGGDRVGTLAWNGHRHLELYHAVGGAGMVCHTINPRLFPEQIAYIIDHAGDSVLFVDPGFVPLLEGLLDRLARPPRVVVLADAAGMPASSRLPGLLCYEDLLAEAAEDFDWPDLDENTACSLCYTSGTTGEPKGVLYSHRSAVLHAMAIVAPDVFALSARSVAMPVVPMFHVNAWGLPYAAPMVGAKLVLPGPKLDGASLHALIEEEGVTFTAGVPTVWMALLNWMAENGRRFGPLQRVIIGGSACPPVMIERFRAHGVHVVHAWGMTETSPLGAASTPKAKHEGWPEERLAELAAKQGRPLFGVGLRVVDGQGREIARDGTAHGSLLVRGPWVASGYFRQEGAPAFAHPGWFETGDVVTMDEDGYVQVVDRTKDVVKSGGEWIGSIELENIALAHPAVREAAVVARPDERWGERPLLVLVLHEGQYVTWAEMARFYEGKIPKWCIPDAMVVVEELPHTATGKLQKARIRDMLRAGKLPPALTS
ncbi:long-chain-fatty-acid--CoA ligase [Roseomonas nepalensis]|uniref:3-methylmercaptopropionyl-CoA ligase n=1 Tax=Muricoccus nepalensis TaxID=1854500 RepID=A0A502G764_9PROT|nr:long-chain fatty acid--CoA ligase [Roseomonas nepalensis]TPG57698.1 long-chain-fatty-acid--CoA ligase [Roseomonas nepalensis]